MIFTKFGKAWAWIAGRFACCRRPLQVTFDTNSLDRVVRPERFTKDPRRANFLKIHRALKRGRLKGFFSETILTLEGIEKLDRITVFNSTTIKTDIADTGPSSDDKRVNVTLTVLQPGRKPIHPEMAARVKAAVQLGLRALSIPRIAFIGIEDPSGKFFVQQTETEMGKRQQRTFEAARQIEQRGVGMTRVKDIAKRFSSRDGVSEPWYRSLIRARDIHEENEVKRAVSEWADGDMIAAHIGYQIDYFCTEDHGRSGGAASILDTGNRAWLSQTYCVKFLTIDQLARELSFFRWRRLKK